MGTQIYLGQDKVKDCVVGNREMNRYGIFNGLERPRRISNSMTVDLLGYDSPVITSVSVNATAGSLEVGKWYSYKAVYASTTFTRPVAVADGSSNMTRGNGSSTPVATIETAGNTSMSIVIPSAAQTGVTRVLLYRSLGASTQAEANAGPWYYVGQGTDSGSGTVTIVDGVIDTAVGLAIETDNYPPNSYRYAIEAYGYIFAIGSVVLGSGYTVTVAVGAPLVVVNTGIFYDGIRGWVIRIEGDTGGFDGHGSYYANYVNSTTLTLVDSSNASTNYNGSLAGSGRAFTVTLAGNVLRWSKYQEPESWPLENAVALEGGGTGLGLVPNTSMLVVCVDTPRMWVFDLTLAGTYNFKTNKRIISTTHSPTSHYSIVGVDNALRALDISRACILETDGVTVKDISSMSIPKVFQLLSPVADKVINWHCAYDPKQHIFAAFVALKDSSKYCDFSINQNTITGQWFFNMEKDLLCSASYLDPVTNEAMVLGGTQGISSGGGAVWGRIWSPNIYSEWVPLGSLTYGSVVSSTPTVLTVDNTSLSLTTTGAGVVGRWVLVCDSEGENAQLAYIGSNTANTITIDYVVNGVNSGAFSPIPDSTWKFYIGMIEMRWGPKRFDFDDITSDKKIWEVALFMNNINEADPPIIRYYRGLELGYLWQKIPDIMKYRGKSGAYNNTLVDRYSTHGEPTPVWGLAVIDRSYNETTLENVTIMFNTIGGVEKK